jgi:gas vesicle protein
MEDTATERHPFRALLKFLMVVGVVAAVGRFIASKKEEYYGLTESEAREKFESKLGPRIGEDKASEVADQLIPRLKDSGVIKPDPVEQAMNDVKDAASDAMEKVVDVTDAATDGAEDVADDMRDAAKKAAKRVEEKID